MEHKVNYMFIIGCARSGTSILGELIASNPNIKYIFEASHIWELGGMGENESHRLTAQHATGPVKQQIRDWFDSQSEDKNIIVEKNPRNSLRIPYLKEIFPEAKFIHIVRDGRDVACSMVPGCGGVEWNHLKPPSWREYYANYSGAIRCAHTWKEVLEIALADLPQVPYLQVRYEDLLTSPLFVAESIFEFLNVDIHEDTVEFCKKITSNTASSYHAKYQDRWYRKDHSARVGRWRENLNGEEQETINHLLKPLLTTLGYINQQESDGSNASTLEGATENRDQFSDKKLVVVLGMHRGGTSAVARGLQVLGVKLGNKLLAPMEGVNEKGFWEDADFNALNIEMLYSLKSDWHTLRPITPSEIEELKKNGYFLRAVRLLQEKTAGIDIFGVKDPRAAKLLPFWKDVFAHNGMKASYVIVTRNPLSVCESLKKRDGFDDEKNYLLWLEHMLSSLIGTENENYVLVDFDNLMQSPTTEITRIAQTLRLTVDSSELENFQTSFLDDGLRHTVYQVSDLASNETVPPIVYEMYQELSQVALDKIRLDDPAFRKKLVQWNNELLQQKFALILTDKLSSRLLQAKMERNQALQEKRQALQAQQEATSELMSLKASRSWKLSIILVSLFRKFIPPGTWRDRLFLMLHQYQARRQDTSLIRTSSLFDPTWYLAINTDVAQAGIDPVRHYLLNGGFEGRDPSPNFNSSWYLREYSDVRISGENPLIHYLKHGKAEGRAIQQSSIQNNLIGQETKKK